MELPKRVTHFQPLGPRKLTNDDDFSSFSLIDRCEDDEATSLRVKCEDFCRELYNDIGVARGDGVPASHTSSYLLAAMVDLHADKLEFEGCKMTIGEREEELQSAKKVPGWPINLCSACSRIRVLLF